MTTARPLMIDLCCGLGGASKPFRDGGWRVIGVDLAARVKPDIVADVRYLPLRARPRLLWASPPCQAFTGATLPKTWRCNRLPIGPAIALVSACRWAIRELRPFAWVIENVPRSQRWLIPLLGTPAHRVIGHTLWTSRSLSGWLIPQTRAHKWKVGPGPMRPWVRSLIPYEIGASLRWFLEEQGRGIG